MDKFGLLINYLVTIALCVWLYMIFLIMTKDIKISFVLGLYSLGYWTIVQTYNYFKSKKEKVIKK